MAVDIQRAIELVEKAYPRAAQQVVEDRAIWFYPEWRLTSRRDYAYEFPVAILDTATGRLVITNPDNEYTAVYVTDESTGVEAPYVNRWES